MTPNLSTGCCESCQSVMLVPARCENHSCPCHNPGIGFPEHSPKETPSNWEVEFEDKFLGMEILWGHSLHKQTVKDFIRQLLNTHTEELRGKVEGMREIDNDCQHGPSDSCDSNCAYQSEIRADNAVIDRVLALLPPKP